MQLERKISELEKSVQSLRDLNASCETAKLEFSGRLVCANIDITAMKREKGQHKRSMSLAQKKISNLEIKLQEANATIKGLENLSEEKTTKMTEMKLRLEVFKQLREQFIEVSIEGLDSMPGSPRQSPRARSRSRSGSPHRAVADSTGGSGQGSPGPRSRSRTPLQSEDFDSE